MTLLLIRHGETELNAARVLQPEDTPLSALGQRQAAALAPRIAALRPAAIVSSDLPRALRTAEAIARATGLVVATHPLLRERNFGAWRGLAVDSLGIDPLAMADAPPGGESAAAFDARAAQAFDFLLQLRAASCGALVVVTHGLLIRSLIVHRAALMPGMQAPRRLENTSLTILGALPPHEVSLLGCARHLDADALEGVRNASIA